MDNQEEYWKKEVNKFKAVQICPKCGKPTLKYIEEKMLCTECGFEQTVGKVI